MIYTVTMNPSLDYNIKLSKLNIGKVNRAESESLSVGGKGINVSLVLKELGDNVKALGFYGSDIGKLIIDRLSIEGIDNLFFEVCGVSRINVKLQDGHQTEINGKGINIKSSDIDKLLNGLKALNENDVLVLAGSVRSELKDDTYKTVMSKINPKAITVVDACGKLLTNTLPYHPFLIKPNLQELSEIFGEEIKTYDKITECAKKLQKMGARNVLVSLGGDGAILVSESGKVLKADSPKGNALNAVGAGDSMVAGFIHGFLKHKDLKTALAHGVSAGSATAFSDGLADKESIRPLLNRVKIYKL